MDNILSPVSHLGDQVLVQICEQDFEVPPLMPNTYSANNPQIAGWSSRGLVSMSNGKTRFNRNIGALQGDQHLTLESMTGFESSVIHKRALKQGQYIIELAYLVGSSVTPKGELKLLINGECKDQLTPIASTYWYIWRSKLLLLNLGIHEFSLQTHCPGNNYWALSIDRIRLLKVQASPYPIHH